MGYWANAETGSKPAAGKVAVVAAETADCMKERREHFNIEYLQKTKSPKRNDLFATLFQGPLYNLNALEMQSDFFSKL